MVVQKTIFAGLIRAAAAASTVRQTHAAAAARWRNTTPLPARLLLYGRAGHLFLFLLCFSFTHTPYYTWQSIKYKKLSCRRETALQGGLFMAKSGRLELGDNILPTSVFNQNDVIGQQSNLNR